MNTKLACLAVILAALPLQAADFTRATTFESVAEFIETAKAFSPAAAKTDLSALFTVPEPGQREDPKLASPVSATHLDACTLLWSDERYALVFATASPPTVATISSVGVLFLLEQKSAKWAIADVLRLAATGKESAISAELTSGSSSGTKLGGIGRLPVVTIKKTDGGRGYWYDTSASFTIEASRIKPKGLE